MQKVRIVIGLVLCVAATFTTAASAHADGLAPVPAAGVTRQAPPAGAPVDRAAAGIAGFGYQLSRRADPKSNWVASPLSIAYAFAMARAGAGGQTAAELDRTFGFPSAGRDAAYNALGHQVASTDRQATVRLADALFTAARAPVARPFVQTLAAQYGAGVYPVDFTSPTATEKINQWVGRQTDNRIKRLFDQLDPGTDLVIANAVYLHADWAHPFEAAQTAPARFTRAGGRAGEVPTMNTEAVLGYAEGDGWQAVELPYAHADLAMWVLLPAAGRSPDALLAPDNLASVRAKLRPTVLSLALPKWDFDTTIDLAEPLGAMGVRAAFDPDRADFSGIRPGLFISQAVHRATITVDEQGTTAAAATGIAMTAKAVVASQLVVRADHPFAFAVVQRTSGVPLFIGHVAAP